MKEPISLSPFKHLCMTIGNLPASYVDSMSYYECLLWLINYLQKTVIPAINNNAEAVKEIQEWIKNLDIQDEVDNKLDEMAESGELQELITAYINLRSIITFPTVNDLINSENLIDGSVVKTLGYYSIGDGGSCDYVISNNPTNTVLDIKLSNGKYAITQIKDNFFNVLKFGVKADNTTDNTDIIQSIINYATTLSDSTVYFPNSTNSNKYMIDSITIKRNVSIKGNGAYIGQVNSNNNMFVLDSGMITNNNYSLKIEGIHVVPNELNQKAIIFDFTAIKGINESGGLLHAQLKDIIIGSLKYDQIGFYFYANDTEQEIDVANQYLELDNVNVYRKSSNAICLYLKGQIGQLQLSNSEFNGDNKTLGGVSVKIEGLDSNDSALLPTVFTNTTFQTASNPLFIDNKANVILNECHFEQNNNSIIIDNLSNVTMNNCNISSSGNNDNGVIGVGTNSSLVANGTTIYGVNSPVVYALNNNVDFRNIHFNTFAGEVRHKNIGSLLTITDSYKLYTLNRKTLIYPANANSDVTISEIHSNIDCDDEITLINLSDHNLIITNSLQNSGDGIKLPDEYNRYVIRKNQSIKLKRIFTTDLNNRWIVENFYNENMFVAYSGSTLLAEAITLNKNINNYRYIEILFSDDSNRKASSGKMLISANSVNHFNLHTKAFNGSTSYEFLADVIVLADGTTMQLSSAGGTMITQTSSTTTFTAGNKIAIKEVLLYK